jgi:DNA-binding phage protein
MKHLDPDAYLDSPARAIALLNAVMSSGGSDDAVEQALIIVALALRRAGFRRPGGAAGSRRWRDEPRRD